MAIPQIALEPTIIAGEVDRFEKAFDEKLKEYAGFEGGLRSHTWGSDEKPGYRSLMVVVPGTMSPATKNELRNRYGAAGWIVREVKNSGDNGEERLGLAAISFWIKE